MIKVVMPKEVPPIENEYGIRNKSVIQFVIGDKFLITKTVNPEWTIEELKRTFGKYLRGGISEANMFYPLVKYLYKQESKAVRVDFLFTSTSGYEVLKKELELLVEHFGSKGCLNPNNVPYVPKTTAQHKGSDWLTPNEMMNFSKLLKKYEY